MPSLDLLMLDLDGTLIDTKDDIAASVNWLRSRWKLPAVGVEQVLSWVGDGVSRLVARSLGMSLENHEVREAVALFRDHYRVHMLDRSRPFPGVPEGLRRFRESGLVLAVISNKPHALCVEIFDRTGLRDEFIAVLGGDSLPVKKPDPAPLLHVMDLASVGAARAAMVGDGTQDIEAGKAAGVMTIAALYGFRPRRSLEPLEPDHLIASFDRLREIV
jgi:phosphoglycolate phosphatase